MQLFQNRAGLKKAYADLQDEFHLLRDRLKQQEGATIRVEEQLATLADLLADPRTGFGALVFFQLRGLWKSCHQQLADFTAELLRRQEARESAKHKGQCEAARAARLADVDRRLNLASCDADDRRRRLNVAQTEIDGLTALWHYFERRRRQKALATLRHALVRADAAVGDLHAERSALADEPLEDFPGISLAARRSINLVVIAYAEILCEQVDAFALAARAKEAVARRVHEMSFGTRAECDDYMVRVQKAQLAVADRKRNTAALKGKLERLRAVCEYRNAADTVPTADSLSAAAVQGGGRAGAAGPGPVRAAAEWGRFNLRGREASPTRAAAAPGPLLVSLPPLSAAPASARSCARSAWRGRRKSAPSHRGGSPAPGRP